jgi:hypothetical protein
MKLKLLFTFLLVQVAFAQHRTCGTAAFMDRMMANPEFRQQYLEEQQRFEIELERLNNEGATNRSTQAIRIPVAVHFPSVSAGASAILKNCLRALAQNQINILNADYNAANADISTWNDNDTAFFPGVTVGNLGVNFELATLNHPAGVGIAEGTVAVTFGTDYLSGADSDSTWSGYINLVVRNISGGILGYSPLGGTPNTGATVVINSAAFGSGSGCTGYVPGEPYNLGRTLTHELGHYFNLAHTFDGCGTNCNTTGDRVCDTPPLNVENYGCPVAGEVADCNGGPALTMNYMDYTDDACMYMFTLGQETRMRVRYNVISTQIRGNTLANESFLESKFSLYPNPTRGSFSIAFKEAMGYSVQVFDVTGKVVFENNFDENSSVLQTINIDNAEKGIYFVNIKTNNGLVTKKVVIE